LKYASPIPKLRDCWGQRNKAAQSSSVGIQKTTICSHSFVFIIFGVMRIVWTLLFISSLASAKAQRTYATNSVLSNGNWYRLSVKQAGVYKIDLAFLNALGVNTSNIASNSIRLFGNGSQMLPEANNAAIIDDLFENAIEVVDGGDGLFNGQDYLLFYAAGPDAWFKDSVNQKFRHQKNLYSNEAYYFLSIGANGKRILAASAVPQPATLQVADFDERYFFETDTINFLSSGREWYGEEFSSTPGNQLSRNYSLPQNNLVAGSSLRLVGSLAARSVGANSRFDIRANGNLATQATMFGVSGGFLDLFAYQVEQQANTALSQNNLQISIGFVPGVFNAQGWLNWLEVFCRRQLNMAGNDQLSFRDWASVGPANIVEFVIQNASNSTQVWNITNPLQPQAVVGNLAGNSLRVKQLANRLQEYIAFNNANHLRPTPLGAVAVQNLHQPGIADFIIVTPASLLAEAQRLAQFHLQQYGQRVVVATTTQIFNEFASGAPDPTAIRNYVKMFYDRAAGVAASQPKYLLLFGDASFDYKNRINGNTNLVPCFQSANSLDPLGTFVSDDYFGLLDDADDVNAVAPPGLLDIGIGRIPVSNGQQAKTIVDKIIAYHSPAALGAWRNQIAFVADDEDNNLHLNDAESIVLTTQQVDSILNLNKIYLDAFRQESGSGGSRYPAANQAIINQLFKGTLIWNYNGHGGYKRLAEEAILDQDVVNQFNNENRLPLFITATCDFAPYDNPTLQSLGEDLLVKDKKGAIALMTTTRVVFAFSNRLMNDNYLRFALQPNANGQFLALGDAVRVAKNYTYQTSGDVINNRKFTLIGDPAMRLAFPSLKVKTNSINGVAVLAGNDTLKALGKYNIAGQVTDNNGVVASNFNGNLTATIFDKKQNIATLGNDAGSPIVNFGQQTAIAYKGTAQVVNGNFNFSFVVPKDINLQFGSARISYYAENGQLDAASVYNGVQLGGIAANAVVDNDGPIINAFLNDEKFANGGIVGEQPLLILKLSDTSGINTVGTGIGHDLTAVLDDDNRNVLVLNDFYQSATGDYTKGTVRYQLPKLANGPHRLKIKAWDAANNSSETYLDFEVQESSDLKIAHVYNYPNPFTTKTSFWFEHNQAGSQLKLTLKVFTVAGKLVKQEQKTIMSTGNRFCELDWDGTDDFGNKLARGVYIYQITVSLPNGKQASKTQKLYIL
jgi:hypothetical protein